MLALYQESGGDVSNGMMYFSFSGCTNQQMAFRKVGVAFTYECFGGQMLDSL